MLELTAAHLALITEMLGPFPPSIWASGKRSQKYFRRNGELRNIQGLKFLPLNSVLIDKYKVCLRATTVAGSSS